MGRSIDELLTRKANEIEKQKKRNRATYRPTGGRGIESIYEDRQRYFQEAGEEESEETSDDEDEVDNDDSEALSEDNGEDPEMKSVDAPEVKTDDDDDDDDDDENLSSFGQHGDDDLPNNQYDQTEVAKIMEFVAAEAKSLSDYIEASKTSKMDVLQRLYSDIADEERYHLEQLLFAKAEITGEEYKPQDPDIRKEYEELLNMGMGESEAMATAVDKFNLKGNRDDSNTADEQSVKEMEEIEEAVEEMDRTYSYLTTVSLIMEQCHDEYIVNKVTEINGPILYQEDVNVTVNQKYSGGTINAGTIIGTFFAAVHKLLKKLATWIRQLLNQNYARVRKLIEYTKRHGIGSLFASGVDLYTWNDKTGMIDVEPILHLVNCALYVTQDAIRDCKMQLSSAYGRQILSFRNIFDDRNFKNSRCKGKIAAKAAAEMLATVDPIKTKVVPNNNNQANLISLFQVSNEDQVYIQNHQGQGLQSIPATGLVINVKNIFNILDICIEGTDYFMALLEKFTGDFNSMEGDTRSVYYTNRKIFDIYAGYLEGCGKGLNKLSKALAFDAQQMEKMLQKVATPIAQTQQPTRNPNP